MTSLVENRNNEDGNAPSKVTRVIGVAQKKSAIESSEESVIKYEGKFYV